MKTWHFCFFSPPGAPPSSLLAGRQVGWRHRCRQDLQEPCQNSFAFRTQIQLLFWVSYSFLPQQLSAEVVLSPTSAGGSLPRAAPFCPLCPALPGQSTHVPPHPPPHQPPCSSSAEPLGPGGLGVCGLTTDPDVIVRLVGRLLRKPWAEWM